METLSWFWDVFWNIFKVALGLGFVIFIHELGHFLLAKWNGVKVEKFSIGFGPTLFGFRRGETEYVLAAIPLGGFVKMLGEGPEDEASKSTDPRAYPNKIVGARMAIISAGVIMNVFLGLACFVYAYGHGMDEMPARVGAVEPASPAYEAGMRAGDEIVAIDGRRDLSLNSMTLKVALSGQGQVLHFDVKRPGHEGLIDMDIQPRREAGSDDPRSACIPASLSLLVLSPPAGMTNPPSTHSLSPGSHAFRRYPGGGRPGRPGADPRRGHDQYHACSPASRPAAGHVIERREGTERGRPASSEAVRAHLPAGELRRLRVPPDHRADSAIRNGSLADRAGFRKGDRIIKVDGSDEFDPMQLPSLCYEKPASR